MSKKIIGKYPVSHLLILMIFIVGAASAQTTTRFATTADVQKDSVRKRVSPKGCNLFANYIPDTLSPGLTPMRLIRINIHFIQDGNGQNNFSEKEGTAWATKLIEQANNRLAGNQKMLLPHGNTNPAYPIPFRYVLTGDPGVAGDDGIYFHRDDSLFCMNKRAKGKNANNVYDRAQYNKYGVQKNAVINVFLMEHCPDSARSATYKASHDGIGTSGFAKLVGEYFIHKNQYRVSGRDTIRFSPWDASALFNHELGHVLGLMHSWNTDDGCDDTPKNPGCWNTNEPAGCTEVSNNVMDYNASQGAYSPCQIGKIIYGFYSEKQSRKFMVNDWCKYDASKSITIGTGETVEWHRSVDIFGDLVVKNNATLTLHCNVFLPPGGKIILEPKATLILDGCTLTSGCDKPFEGIEIQTTKKSTPQIFFKNGSVVENVLHPL